MNDGHINASMDINNASLDVTFGEVYEIDKGMPAAIIANLYSSQSTYSPGDYVIYRIRLYKCLVAIETPEEFDSTKWELVKVAEELKEKADKSTTYTKTETNALLNEKADATSVYTKTETDALLDEKANSDNVYTKTEADTLLDEKADLQSTLAALSTLSDAIATKADAAGTTAALALKADTSYVNTELDKKTDKTYVDTELGKKADKSSTYTKTEVDTALASKAAADNVYTKLETDEEISDAVEGINSKIASEYDEEEIYYRGDIVWYEGVLYECDNTDASGEFSPSDWKEINVAEGIRDVRDIFYNYYSKTELNPLLNQKMVKSNPSGTGTFSLNRKTNTTVGNYSVVTGYRNTASAYASYSEGYENTASGTASHAQGWQTTASGDASHTEGESTTASGYVAHAEGETTIASGDDSHVEGKNSTASGNVSHAEGENNTASGYGSHAEGYGNTASGLMAHAEGATTTASGYGSHSEGVGTIANHIGQHVVGAYNTADPSAAEPTAKGNYVEIVGNGTGENTRSNARTLDWSGNEVLAGDLTYNGNKSLTSEVQRLDNKIDNLPNPMVYRGSVGIGGTVTELPVDGSANIGDTYKVITAGTYASQLADIGDTFICEDKTASINTWTLIPSGDEPSGTVTSIKIEATSPINIDDNSAITTSGIRTISHANSGVIAGSYGDTSAQTPTVGETFKALSVTVDAKGHITNVNEHTVTMPSVANNVTGAGTSNYLAKFSDTNVITDGVALGSDTTKFLRNDGSWEVPDAGTDANVTQTADTENANYEILFSATADNTTRTEGAKKNSNLTFNPSTGNMQVTKINGVTVGNSPAFTDTTIHNRIAYFCGKTGDKGIWAGSLFMEDNNGTFQNIYTASDGTATTSNRTTAQTKRANTNGFRVLSPIWYSTTSYNANTNISGYGAVYSSFGLIDARYVFNVALSPLSLLAYKEIYLSGKIHADGLFYLDGWWTQFPTDKTKLYVLIGSVYDSTSSNVRISLYEQNKWFKFTGDTLVEFTNQIETDIDKHFRDTLTGRSINFTSQIERQIENLKVDIDYQPTPITEVQILQTGKNLFNPSTIVSDTLINNTTGEAEYSSQYNTSDYIYLEAGKRYYLVGGEHAWFYGLDKQPLSSASLPKIETTQNCYIRFSVWNTMHEVQLEIGSTSSSFESYQSDTRIIDISSYSVYGGYIILTPTSTILYSTKNSDGTDKSVPDEYTLSISDMVSFIGQNNFSADNRNLTITCVKTAVPLAEAVIGIDSENIYTKAEVDNLLSNKAKAPTVITGTLVAGQTSITLQSSAIDDNSTISVYTTDGTEWNSMTVITGQVVITFYAQANDLGVKVEVT